MTTLLEKAKVASKEDFTTLPIIDLTNATSTDPELRQALALEIQHAALTAGFFYVKNHSVSPSLISRTLAQSSKFFSLPLPLKQSISIAHSDNFRGWMGLLTENTNTDNVGDLHEAFNLGLEEKLVTEGTVRDLIRRNSVWARDGTDGMSSEVASDLGDASEKHKVGAKDGNDLLDSAFATSEASQYATDPQSGISFGISDPVLPHRPTHTHAQTSFPLEDQSTLKDRTGVRETAEEEKEDKLEEEREAQAGVAARGGNQWLSKEEWEGAEEFRVTVLEFYTEVLGLGYRLYPLIALALDLPEDFFADKTRNPAVIQRLLYYPPLNGAKADVRKPGIGEHTDYELITILLQDQVGGLEVQNLAGDWIKAESVEGCFVVNFGDQLARWTNDVIRSTRHRAVPPPAFTPRYSIPSFFGCDVDVPLIPIPTCVSEENPSKYEVLLAGDYVQSRLEETYTI